MILRQLLVQYDEVLADEVFRLSVGLSGFVRENEALPFFQFLKYPERISDVGVTWNASIHIDVAVWHNAVAAASVEIRNLWTLILRQHPTDPARFAEKPDGESERPPRKRRLHSRSVANSDTAPTDSD